ncbi:MAG: aspartate dehydrogenase [Beijerinckiaceae bacterium]|jgi:aspartate dehydrogenase|nr:aspartate dehydrogenase [Beijerinckiaceae bacterium]
MKLALIGYGTIARIVLETLGREAPGSLDTLVLVSQPQGMERARRMLAQLGATLGAPLARQTIVVTDIDDALAADPDVIAEAAGHGALQEFGARVLAAGVPLIVTSVGALADDALRACLDVAASESGTNYSLITGAVGGLDILGAVQLSGLNSVLYNSRKPPAAWRGSPAESLCELDAITHETVFFTGNAAEAAQMFPQNANVAATIALKGAGFADTRVNLIADPNVSRNVHELIVSGKSADFAIRIEGWPAPDNPKTSLTTAYSLAQTILARM